MSLSCSAPAGCPNKYTRKPQGTPIGQRLCLLHLCTAVLSLPLTCQTSQESVPIAVPGADTHVVKDSGKCSSWRLSEEEWELQVHFPTWSLPLQELARALPSRKPSLFLSLLLKLLDFFFILFSGGNVFLLTFFEARVIQAVLELNNVKKLFSPPPSPGVAGNNPSSPYC